MLRRFTGTPSFVCIAAAGSFSLLGLAGCSSNEHGVGGSGTASSTGTSLAPPAMGQGVQLEMHTTIDSHTEDERCQFVTTTDDLWVHQETIRYTPVATTSFSGTPPTH